jgi:protein involved in temperature-dependent protein secretion
MRGGGIPIMTIEQCVRQGEFEAALRLIEESVAATPDPGLMLMAFNLEVRLQRFDAAERSIQRLLELAPHLAEPMTEFARNARAEAKLAARLTDPLLAGQRTSTGVPPPHALAYVQAAVHHANGDYAAAAAAIESARQQTPSTPGTLTWRNGRRARFDHLVDSDDLTGPILPCYDGDAVLDLPYAQLRSIHFLDPQMSFDTMWIPTEIVPHNDPPLRVKIPGLYSGTGVASEPALRTGGMTMWDHERGYALGLGQRDLKFSSGADRGPMMVGILQVRSIELDAAIASDRATERLGRRNGFWKRLFS